MLGVLFLCGTTLGARAQFTRFQGYADEQGLGSSDITTLTQAKDGTILLGTQGGLYRYDGTSFRQDATGLSSSEWIVQVATDPAGRVWVITNQSGLFVGDGSRFRKVDTGKALGGGAIDRFTHLLAVGDGEVVLDAGGTLLRAVTGPQGAGPFRPLFGTAVLAAVPALKHARFVVPDPPGGLLIGCGDGLCRFTDGHVTVFGAADGLPPDAWQAALRTPDGTLWLRSLGRLAWRRPGQTGFTALAVPGQHTSYFAGSPQDLGLLADHGNGVLTQGDEGLLDWTGSAWRTYASHADRLPAAEITAMLWDREGSLWVGSGGYGAFRSIGLGVWEHWTKEDGLPSSIVWDMTRLPNGRLWVATDAGSVALGHGAESVGGGNLVTVTSGKGQVWLAPSTGPLLRLDGSGRTTARLPPIGRVFSAMVDRQDRLWLGTRTGLFLVPDADASAAALTARLALSGRRCLMTIDAAGIDWAACQNGVFRRNPDATFQQVISADHLQDQVMGASFTAGGELWIGTEGNGVLRFRIANAHVEPLPPVVSPAIGSNSILFLHRDRRGWVWVGTDHGIDRFDGHSWRHIDSSDGLISNDLDEYSVLEDTDGSMWFGTTHGLSHLIDPDRLPSPEPLHPQITGLSLGSRTLPLDPTRDHGNA